MCFVLYNNVGQSCFDKAKVQSLPLFPCLFNYVQFFIFNYIFIWLLLSFEVHFVYCYPSWLFILFLCGSRAVVVEYLCSLKKEKIHCASPQEFLFMFSFLFPILYILRNINNQYFKYMLILIKCNTKFKEKAYWFQI